MQVWNKYYKGLSELAGKVEFPVVPECCSHNAHMFYLKLENIEDRSEFISYMKENGIGCVFHYIPLHSSPAGLKFGTFSGKDIYTTKESERLVRLPMWYGLTDSQVDYIIEVVKKYFN